MKSAATVIGFVLGLVLPLEVGAQDAYKWSDINCAESRLAAPAGAKCAATNIVSGGDTARGQFRRWSYSTPTAFVFVWESLTSEYMYTRATGVEYIKGISTVARDGREWSEVQRHDGADYYRFKSAAGSDCVGFRRYGPSRSAGHAWIMAGVTCATPRGTPLAQTRITEFIESAKVR
jgi:hypothetical protein